MPLWDVDELVAAANHLQLQLLDTPITRETIEKCLVALLVAVSRPASILYPSESKNSRTTSLVWTLLPY
ncbi:hypothetical protein JG688_00014280 [Phytophthora aleatoria]|uniref:Uncharacterized protein n=1 Tax=Phytophthora aleatoria TaxID=2496075 RepID=A0A8J5ME21_9STRA|nr:hypothetical protein JG688_00014280 [Phytophthora aleatoria]